MRRVNKKAFGEYIREKRIEKGYTQEELANRLNIGSMTISLWENGKRYPDFEMLDDLARELEVSVEDIYENSKREVAVGKIVKIGVVGIIVLVGIIKIDRFSSAPRHKCDRSPDNFVTTEGTETEENLIQYEYGWYECETPDIKNYKYLIIVCAENAIRTDYTDGTGETHYKYTRNGNLFEFEGTDNGIIFNANLIDTNTFSIDGVLYKYKHGLTNEED